ncbi:MAG: beta-propeller fold lactonase family protein [Verrucomicrobiota bacterium]
MRNFILVLLAMTAAAIGGEQRLYIAAGNAIEVHKIDAQSGKLSKEQTLELDGAGPFTVSGDGKSVYVSAKHESGAGLATLARGKDGSLSLEYNAEVNIRGGSLALDKTENFIAGNHYGPGKVTIWKLEDGVYRGETIQELTLEEKAHHVLFSADNRWLLVPATGPNKVFVNAFDAKTGKLTPADPPFASGPSGEDEAQQPRHIKWHPQLPIAYTTQERLEPGVGVWKWDNKNGKLDLVQNIVTKPEGFEGTTTTATLHLTPDNRFLYVSNRDVTDQKATKGTNSIVGFSVNAETGQLTKIGHTPCEHVPRSFCIDKSGRFVYVAGQGDGKLGVYAINNETGALTKVQQIETGARPSWVEAHELW